MATMKTTPERELHDYVADIFEHTDFRAGSPLPLGIQEMGGEVNFAVLSRSRQPHSTGVVRPSRKPAFDLDWPGSRTGCKNKKEN